MTTPATALRATPITAALVRGALELDETDRGLLPHRLPAWARAQAADGQLSMAESQPAGVRLVLQTRATALELDTIPTKRLYVGVPLRPDGVYDVLVDGVLAHQGSVTGGDTLVIDLATGGFEHRPGEPGTLRVSGLPAREKRVEIWLPHDETTVLVALRSDAPLSPANPANPANPADPANPVNPADRRQVWVHHGSSISHGSNATHPTGTWPAIAAAAAGVDLVNLGLGGSALLDPFIGRVLRDTPADLLSVKIGINLLNADLMRRRALRTAVHGLLDTIREGHPDTPLLLISPILCPIHEQTPGPSAPDTSAMSEGRMSFVATGDPADVASGRLTLEVVREELATIVAARRAEDPHLAYLDGRELYGAADEAADPLPDALHPGPQAHRLIGERFAALAFGEHGRWA